MQIVHMHAVGGAETVGGQTDSEEHDGFSMAFMHAGMCIHLHPDHAHVNKP